MDNVVRLNNDPEPYEVEGVNHCALVAQEMKPAVDELIRINSIRHNMSQEDVLRQREPHCRTLRKCIKALFAAHDEDPKDEAVGDCTRAAGYYYEAMMPLMLNKPISLHIELDNQNELLGKLAEMADNPGIRARAGLSENFETA